MPFSERTWAVLEGRDEGPISAEEFAWNSRFRHLLVLFGDGAGAMVFRASPRRTTAAASSAPQLYGDGDHKDILTVPGAGLGAPAVRRPPSRSRRPRRCR